MHNDRSLVVITRLSRRCCDQLNEEIFSLHSDIFPFLPLVAEVE